MRFYTERIKWYFKQFLPLTYVSEYDENGKQKVTIWRMWFGRCFDIRSWEVIK